MSSKLFQPIQFGHAALKHRVVMAPLTRNRGDKTHTHTDLALEHYSTRASVPGTLIITEATFISHKASGYTFHAPGIWREDQIASWKKIVDAVHARGSFIYLQIWALGRSASPEQLALEDPSFPYVGAGDVPIEGFSKTPRALTKDEIKEYVQLYATAAANGVHKAGFDGVEIHGANGYLVDQFLKEHSNNRTDEYGGTPEKRTKFALEVVEAVTAAIGAERVGLRLSPWPSAYEPLETYDPRPTYSHLVTQIRERFPSFGYLHVVEPRIRGSFDRENNNTESNDFLRDIWGSRTWVSAGGYVRENAIKQADERGEIIAFGRLYTSNPDLPIRLEKNLPLTPYDRSTFYTLETPVGYNDYLPAQLEKEAPDAVNIVPKGSAIKVTA
ncbi:NADH:flavin oxidoreductase/NADH oxidase [Artomyces pyxidatus]|uniref:NADH:flavin oxidoreductase/NADH oxidase n=1 Tax=Artomyces pyxidatus TaxID=48021 RepID=A0ACB8T5Z8_9AGAM|nr:NADH:flavin oxidoreductase/NADH oxidase [Artomyces pyxidatus]